MKQIQEIMNKLHILRSFTESIAHKTDNSINELKNEIKEIKREIKRLEEKIDGFISLNNKNLGKTGKKR